MSWIVFASYSLMLFVLLHILTNLNFKYDSSLHFCGVAKVKYLSQEKAYFYCSSHLIPTFWFKSLCSLYREEITGFSSQNH